MEYIFCYTRGIHYSTPSETTPIPSSIASFMHLAYCSKQSVFVCVYWLSVQCDVLHTCTVNQVPPSSEYNS